MSAPGSRPNGMPDSGSLLEAAEAAANQPTQFAARERAGFVRERIEEIRHLVALGKTKDEIKEITGRFHEDYPTLFQMATEKNFQNGANLNLMLGLLDKMGSGSMSQHQASVIVGQRLMDLYVKPSLGGTGAGGTGR